MRELHSKYLLVSKKKKNRIKRSLKNSSKVNHVRRSTLAKWEVLFIHKPWGTHSGGRRKGQRRENNACGEQVEHTKWENAEPRAADRFCIVNRHWRENETMRRRAVVWREIDGKSSNFIATITWVCSELFDSFSLFTTEIIARPVLDNVQRKRPEISTLQRTDANDERTVTTGAYRPTWRSRKLLSAAVAAMIASHWQTRRVRGPYATHKDFETIFPGKNQPGTRF